MELVTAHYFEVCGLLFRSDEPLGDLPLRAGLPGDAHVHIKWHMQVARRASDTPRLFGTTIGEHQLDVYGVDGGTLWEYPDDTRFWVSAGGDEVRCEYPPHFALVDAATYVLGPILGYILRQRGVRALHASTVLIGDVAVAIAGPAGAGKSTLTAALVARGHALVAEDVSALRGAEVPVVAPGVPFVKLWPDSAAAHGKLPLLTPNWDKHYLRAPRLAGDSPLGAVFFVETAAKPGVEPLTPRDAMVALVDNVYVSYALTSAERRADLEAFAAIAERVPCFRLFRTESYDDLGPVCGIVESASR